MKVKLLLLLIILIAGKGIYAQTNIYSRIIFDPSDEIRSNDMEYDFDSGFLLTASARLIKIDINGDIVYSKKCSHYADLYNINKTLDSCFFITGMVYNPNTLNYNILIAKTDATGQLLFANTMGANNQIAANSACLSHDNGIVVCGNVSSTSLPYKKMLIAKFNSDGQLIWEKVLKGGNTYNYAIDIKLLPDSGFIIIGNIQNGSSFPSTTRASLIKLDQHGNVISAYTFESVNSLNSTGQGILPYNNFIYCILSNNIIIKLNENMQPEWCYAYSFFGGNGYWSYNFKPVKLAISTRNTLYHSGIGMNEIDTLGNEIAGWDAFLESTTDILETPDKGFLIAGNGPMLLTKEQTLYMAHVGLIKSDSLRNTVNCAYSYYNQGKIPRDLFLIPDTITEYPVEMFSENLPVTFYDYPSFSDFGCVDAIGSNHNYYLESNVLIYPNPSSEFVYIELPETTVGVEIFKSTGLLVKQISRENQKIELSVKDWPEGMYLVKIITTKGVVMSKFVKSK